MHPHAGYPTCTSRSGLMSERRHRIVEKQPLFRKVRFRISETGDARYKFTCASASKPLVVEKMFGQINLVFHFGKIRNENLLIVC